MSITFHETLHSDTMTGASCHHILSCCFFPVIGLSCTISQQIHAARISTACPFFCILYHPSLIKNLVAMQDGKIKCSAWMPEIIRRFLERPNGHRSRTNYPSFSLLLDHYVRQFVPTVFSRTLYRWWNLRHGKMGIPYIVCFEARILINSNSSPLLPAIGCFTFSPIMRVCFWAMIQPQQINSPQHS